MKTLILKTNKTPSVPKKPFEIQREIFNKTKKYHKLVPSIYSSSIESFIPEQATGTITDTMVFTFDENNIIFNNQLSYTK